MKKALLAAVAAVVMVSVVPSSSMSSEQDSKFQPLFPADLVKAVSRDFGVCLEFYRTQYDYAGWVQWNDGWYTVIFQNEPLSVTKVNGGGLVGNDGPGIQFFYFGKRWREVHALAVPVAGYGFGSSRGKYKPWSFGLEATGRASLNVYSWPLHPSRCR